MNKENNLYEKKIKVNIEGGKNKGKTELVTIRALNLDSDEGNGLQHNLYYSCNPKDNGEHMFIGLLLKGDNPNNQPMPCCFKRDPFFSKNNTKLQLLLENIRKKKINFDVNENKN